MITNLATSVGITDEELMIVFPDDDGGLVDNKA
jgi:hypothetical protein